MITSRSEDTSSLPPKLSRRKVVAAGAWSVPAIALAVAAPSAAASDICPTIPTPNTWAQARSNLSPATGNGGAEPTTSGFSQYGNATGTAFGTYVVTTTIPVRAGRTYNIPVRIFAGYGNGNADSSREQGVQFFVNGSNRFQAATRATTGWTTLNINQYTNYTISYPATTTGNVELRIVFTVVPLSGSGRSANDDIVVEFNGSVTCPRT